MNNDLTFYNSVINPIEGLHFVGYDFIKKLGGDVIR
jgi:hypothetical protein